MITPNHVMIHYITFFCTVLVHYNLKNYTTKHRNVINRYPLYIKNVTSILQATIENIFKKSHSMHNIIHFVYF
jgi:hypothetical protein